MVGVNYCDNFAIFNFIPDVADQANSPCYCRDLLHHHPSNLDLYDWLSNSHDLPVVNEPAVQDTCEAAFFERPDGDNRKRRWKFPIVGRDIGFHGISGWSPAVQVPIGPLESRTVELSARHIQRIKISDRD